MDNKDKIFLCSVGTVRVETTVRSVVNHVTLYDVLHGPDIIYVLTSVSQMWRKGFRFIIKDDEHDCQCKVFEIIHKDIGCVKLVGMETRDGLYSVGLRVCNENEERRACDN